MARHMTIRSEDRQLVVTVFEEGVNTKQVKREMDGSYHMNTLHQMNGAYDYQTNQMEYIKGDRYQ